MKTSLRRLSILSLALLAFAGCQTTGSESSSTWRRPGYFGGPKKSVAVAVLAYRPETRAKFENALVAALRQRGVSAKATYPSIDTQTIVSNKSLAIERAKALGVDSVLAVRMGDKETLQAMTISPGNSGATMQPWQNWFDFFTVRSAFATSPEMVKPGSTIGVQATFFESPSGTLLWSATLFPRVSGSDDQARAFANAIVQKLKAAALIP